MRDEVRDCIIIGGGASGLFAASYLKYLKPSLDITLIEKMPRVGKKLLLTGSGRCNITNNNVKTDKYHTDCPDRLKTVLKSFSVNDTVGFYENNLGVVLTSKDELYYPLTYRSATVLDALRFYIDERDVETVLEDPVVRISDSNNGYMVALSSGKHYSSGNVIFACGGRSYPKTGSDGSSMDLIRSFVEEDDIVDFTPALVPLNSDKQDIKNLAGIRFTGSVAVVSEGTEHDRSEGEILFSKDGGLTGIAVLDVSDTALRLIREGKKTYASLNLTGSGAGDVLRMLYIRRQLFPVRNVCDCFSGILHRVLLENVLRDCHINPNMTAASINDNGLALLSNTISNWMIPINGSKGFDDAQVSSGGIKLSSLTDNLEYSKSRGLYFAGEAINVNGICGGYNLQWAWSSAACAARGVLNV